MTTITTAQAQYITNLQANIYLDSIETSAAYENLRKDSELQAREELKGLRREIRAEYTDVKERVAALKERFTPVVEARTEEIFAPRIAAYIAAATVDPATLTKEEASQVIDTLKLKTVKPYHL